MRQLIEKIKERSDKLNDLLICESIDNEQVAEEAKAAYYDVVDLRNTLNPWDLLPCEIIGSKSCMFIMLLYLICSKTLPGLKEKIKNIDKNAAAHLSFYAIALEGLRNITKDKLKQISEDANNRNRRSNKASDGER